MTNEIATLRFNDLTDAGRHHDALPPSHRNAALDLLDYIHAAGPLETNHAWKLDMREECRLEARFGYTPDGGWARLCHAFAGTGALRVNHQGFYAVDDRSDWNDTTDDVFRVRMTESFTRFFVPPMVAAGQFVLLGMHPVWGLHLAKLQGNAGDDVFKGESFLADEDLKAAETAAFGMMAVIFEALAALPTHHSYPITALSPVILSAARFARSKAERLTTHRPNKLPVFAQGEHGGPNSAAMFADDLVQQLLIPAGMATQLPCGRVVFHPAIANVRVGNLTRGESRLWFDTMMAPVPTERPTLH